MASNERQRTLLQRLNAHLEGLSRAIEQVVAEGLSVRLQPVDLRLEKPSAASFHHSLQALFDAGAPRPLTPKLIVVSTSFAFPSPVTCVISADSNVDWIEPGGLSLSSKGFGL